MATWLETTQHIDFQSFRPAMLVNLVMATAMCDMAEGLNILLKWVICWFKSCLSSHFLPCNGGFFAMLGTTWRHMAG